MRSSVAKRPLAPNHKLVYEALREAARPMTAYELIDAVRPAGISAPPTVYRALNRLTGDGLAHRLESLNAYVACTRDHGRLGHVVFTICNDCGTAREVADDEVAADLLRCASEQRFAVRTATLELRGLCESCADAALVDKVKEIENVDLKGAVMDGQVFVGPDQIEALSKYPTREEAIAQVVQVVLGPASQIAGCLTAGGGQIAAILDTIKDKLENGEEIKKAG